MTEAWFPVSHASGVCRVCGVRVSMLEAPLHIEDHKQAGEFPPGLAPQGDMP